MGKEDVERRFVEINSKQTEKTNQLIKEIDERSLNLEHKLQKTQDDAKQSEICKVREELLDDVSKEIETRFEKTLEFLEAKRKSDLESLEKIYENNIQALGKRHDNIIEEINVKHENDLTKLREELTSSFQIVVQEVI